MLAGQQVGLERRGVLDRLDHDALEVRRLAPPGRVRLEHDVRAGRDLGDAIGTEVEAGVGRVGVEGGALAVGRGIGSKAGRSRCAGSEPEVVDRVVVEGQPRSTCIVKVLSSITSICQDAPVELGVADAALRMPADLLGEQHVVGGDGRAVAPGRLRADGVGDRDALACRRAASSATACRSRGSAARCRACRRAASRCVVGGERPLRHARARSSSQPSNRCSGAGSTGTG